MDKRITIIQGHPDRDEARFGRAITRAYQEAVVRAEAGRRLVALAALAAVPMIGAVIGAWIDETMHLGFSTWRSSCRSAAFSYSSLLSFTLELLPTAIVGLLLGGMVVQGVAFTSTRHSHRATCVAAHAGCALAMPFGLALCALAMPLPLMLLIDLSLMLFAAWLVAEFLRNRPRAVHP
jgi:hypothetical protein